MLAVRRNNVCLPVAVGAGCSPSRLSLPLLTEAIPVMNGEACWLNTNACSSVRWAMRCVWRAVIGARGPASELSVAEAVVRPPMALCHAGGKIK